MGRKIYSVDDHYFDSIDTEVKAYIFGFYYADGCNYEDTHTLKLEVTESDEYILNRFIKEFKYTGNIKHYSGYYNTHKTFGESNEYLCQPTVRLIFRSKQISEQLALKGCISNKSKFGLWIKKDTIPDNLMRHFIRGYFDGNGGVSYWTDNLETGHKKFQFNFCGTKDIIYNLSELISERFNCSPSITARFPDRDNNNLQFSVCGNRIVASFLNWIYKDSTIYLERKHEKYLLLLDEIKRIDNDDKLYGNAFPRKSVIYHPTNTIYKSVTDAARKNNISASVITNRCKSANHPEWDYYQGECS